MSALFVLSPFAALCTVGFFARLSYALARSPVLPLFAFHLGAGPEAIGLAVGISTVTGIFFKLPAGALSDIIGRKKTMQIGLLFFALTPFAYLGIENYVALVCLRFAHGLATAIYGPVAMAVVVQVAGGRKAEMLSWFSSITIIGNLLGAPLGGFILHSAASTTPTLWHFHLAYLVSGASGMLAFILSLGLLRENQTKSAGLGLAPAFRNFAAGIKEVGGDKKIILTSSMEGLQNMTVGALEAFLPIYAVTVAGLDAFQAGILWGLQVVTTILAKPLMGKRSDNSGRIFFVAAGLVLCAVSFGLIPLLTTFAALMAAAAVFGLGEALVTSSSAALVADLCRERHFGTAMGAFGTIFDIGHAAGPLLAGFLLARFSYQLSFQLMASLLLVALPYFMFSTQAATGKKRRTIQRHRAMKLPPVAAARTKVLYNS